MKPVKFEENELMVMAIFICGVLLDTTMVIHCLNLQIGLNKTNYLK